MHGSKGLCAKELTADQAIYVPTLGRAWPFVKLTDQSSKQTSAQARDPVDWPMQFDLARPKAACLLSGAPRRGTRSGHRRKVQRRFAGDGLAWEADQTFKRVSESRYTVGMAKLRSLWFGELPLGDAFWTWAITIGLLVNVTTSVLFLTMIVLDRPWAALLLGYALSVPYNLLAMVGVWRSAARYQAPSGHADLARFTTLLVMVLLTVT